MLNFLKNIFSTKSADIIFAYRLKLPVGIVDARSIKEYMENRDIEVYIFTENKINKSVYKYFEQIENATLIRCDNVREKMKKWQKKEKFQDKKIKKISLDNFGSRPMSYDPS